MIRFIGAAALAVLLGIAIAPLSHVMADDTSDPETTAEGPKPPLPEKSKITGKSPAEVVKEAPQGSLRNPYTDDVTKIGEGKTAFFGNSCNGCHGGGGGGGICPPISNDVWVYGSDDDTLFRLITLGSDGLQSAGYFRKGLETVIAPMPPFGEVIKSDDELWKIIAFVRSLYNGDPKRRNW
jgi:mono/diheme cytochrome c family protein